MIEKMFYKAHPKLLYIREWLVGEIKLKKNKLIQKFLVYDVGKQLIMP